MKPLPGPDARPAMEPENPGMTGVLDRNIAALVKRRRAEQERAGLEEQVSRQITRFAGSMAFVYLHLLIFGFWIVANLGWLGIEPWDPAMVVLAMIASVEAIFLSTFVLITQNRMARMSEKRAELDLQISLLTEHEVTKLMTLLSAVAEKVGVHKGAEEAEVERDVAPEAVMDRIEQSGGA